MSRDGREGKKLRADATLIVVATVAVIIVSFISVASPIVAKSLLEGNGYTILDSLEYTTLLTRANAIKAKTDNLPAAPASEVTAAAAVVNANAAVIAAQAAVVAANISAAKIDLFNSAEVFLFPATTNITVTLTAGNTNAWSAWAEIADNLGTKLSTNFTSKAGYISDMYIYDGSVCTWYKKDLSSIKHFSGGGL